MNIPLTNLPSGPYQGRLIESLSDVLLESICFQSDTGALLRDSVEQELHRRVLADLEAHMVVTDSANLAYYSHLDLVRRYDPDMPARRLILRSLPCHWQSWAKTGRELSDYDLQQAFRSRASLLDRHRLKIGKVYLLMGFDAHSYEFLVRAEAEENPFQMRRLPLEDAMYFERTGT